VIFHGKKQVLIATVRDPSPRTAALRETKMPVKTSMKPTATIETATLLLYARRTVFAAL